MADLARPIPRPGPSKTKILLVRTGLSGVKSVRRSDEPDRLPVKLAIGVIVALGIIAVVWLMGYVGFKLGFASEIVGMPALLGEFDEGLITGTMMLIGVPRQIIMAGIAQPLGLMLGFAMIAIPAAALAATKPGTPGGPKPSQLAVMFSHTGAVTAILSSVVLLFWTASPLRNSMLQELPMRPSDTDQWLTSLQTLAGLDVLAVIAAALWVVLAMRLIIPRWLRVLAVSASFFALVVTAVAMSISNASVTHVEAGRSLIFLDDGALQPRLVIGATREHIVTLVVENGAAVVKTLDKPASMTIVGRQSIADMLKERSAQTRQ